MKKEPKSKKGLIVILVLLIIICLACGVVGYLESTKPKDNKGEKPSEETNYNVAYRYFLDNEEVDTMPEKEELELNNSTEFEGATQKVLKYNYDRYTCTNNVKGEWDEENWEFTPDLTASTTCRLYFVKSMHEITFKASNGTLPSGNAEEKMTAILGKDTVINVKPNDGYKYENVSCTNSQNEIVSEYNEETNDLTIKNVKRDNIVCTVVFGIKSYNVEVSATFGTVAESKQTVNYGENVEFEVTPAENYSFDKVECSNSQNASFTNNRLTITGVTNDTLCNVTFKVNKKQVTVKTEVSGGSVRGNSTVNIEEGSNATFIIDADDGYGLSGATYNCDNGVTYDFQNGVLSVSNVQKDTTCNITLKKSRTSSSSSSSSDTETEEDE